MPKPTESEQGSEANRHTAFVTLDDCIHSAEKLFGLLSHLGAQRHPLDVRKGVSALLTHNGPSRTVRASSRTYFFDVRTGKDGGKYLVITESRIKEKRRAQITLFPEQAQPFLQALQSALSQL